MIAAVALGARLAIVSYGLPYEFDPDEKIFVDGAWRMVESGTWDPRWYGHPASTLMGILAILYATYAHAGVILGSFDTVAAAGAAYHADVTHFFLIGRVVAAISGVAVVVLTYAVLRELRASLFWASAAPLALALAVPLIQFSGLVRSDMLVAAFLLAVVLVMVRTMDTPSRRAFVVAGVLLGLAITSKWPGALGLVAILAVNIALVVTRRITPRQGLGWLAATGVAAVVTAFLVGPYLFFNAWEALGYIAGEARSTIMGGIGNGPTQNLSAYLTDGLTWAFPPIVALLGLAGLAVMLGSPRPRVAAVTAAAYVAFISLLSTWWLRWVIPLLPFAAIGAAFLLDRVEARVSAWRPGQWRALSRAAAASFVVLSLVPSTTGFVAAQAASDDTRIRAIDWIHENVEAGATVLIDSYSAQLSSERFDVLVAHVGELVRWSDLSPKVRPDGYFGRIGEHWLGAPTELLETIEDHDVQYVVLAKLWIDLYDTEAPAFPKGNAVYDALLRAYPVIEEFDSKDAPLGWHILVLDASSVPRH